MTIPAGIIPYGSDHESIIGQASLKTEASITSWGTGSSVATGATIDPVLGIKAGTTGCCVLAGHGSLGLLDIGGQFSFDIETTAIAELIAATESEGSIFANNTYIWTHRDAGAIYGRTWVNSSNTVATEAHTSDTHVIWQTHSLGNDRYSRVTFSWHYGVMDVYANGRYRGSSTRITHVANIFREMFLGSNRGTVSGGSNLTLQNHYIKNALLSTQPVTLAHHPKLRNVYIFGDSYVAQSDEAGSAYYGNQASNVLKAECALRGLHINVTVDGHSGTTINDASAAPLEAFRAALIANNPDIVILQAGINDAVEATIPTNLQTDLNDHIDSILAGSTQTIFLGNSPSTKYNAAYDSATYRAHVAGVNAIMDDAANRWDTANPSDTGRVINYDLFHHLGGDNPYPKVFAGQVGTSRNDDYHLSSKGQMLWGQLLAAKILNYLS